MRKITILLLSLLLFCGMSINAFAQEVTVTTDVPDRHILTVTAEHAQVLYQGETGENFEISRLSEPTLIIRPNDGYKVSKVTLNGEDITDMVVGGYYTMTAVYEEKGLVVETVEVPASTDSIHNISGTLTDENGSPVFGATVDIGGKTAVTDKDGKFEIKDVPDGYHPMTIIDKDGNVISYTEFDLGIGELQVTKNSNGTYRITAPRNSALHMNLTVRADKKAVIDGVSDITPDNSGGLQTGDFTNMILWFSLMIASAGALFIIFLANGRKKAEF